MRYLKIMKKERPFLEIFLKAIPARIETLRELVRQLKQNYTVRSLEILQKEMEELESGARSYAYIEIADSLHYRELDISTKINNFHYTLPPEDWYNEFEVYLNKLEKEFLAHKQVQVESVVKLHKKDEKKRVILVDDDESLTKLLSYELHRLGLEVKVLVTGKEALDYLLKEENLNDVFLVILDRMLPDMDGLDALQQFEANSDTKIPFIVLSALSTEDDILLGLQTGAIDYVTKPFSVYILAQKVLNLFNTQN